jgi:phosphatidylinositol glycan class W
MWIFSVGDSGKMKAEHHKKVDAPPPPPAPPVIQIGNPPPLLDLVNQHSLAIFLLVRVPSKFTFDHILLFTLIQLIRPTF